MSHHPSRSLTFSVTIDHFDAKDQVTRREVYVAEARTEDEAIRNLGRQLSTKSKGVYQLRRVHQGFPDASDHGTVHILSEMALTGV